MILSLVLIPLGLWAESRIVDATGLVDIAMVAGGLPEDVFYVTTLTLLLELPFMKLWLMPLSQAWPDGVNQLHHANRPDFDDGCGAEPERPGLLFDIGHDCHRNFGHPSHFQHAVAQPFSHGTAGMGVADRHLRENSAALFQASLIEPRVPRARFLPLKLCRFSANLRSTVAFASF